MVLLLVIFAIAGVQWVRISDRITVVYLLDQSDSVARAKRDLMLEYAIKSAREHRNRARGDRAGLIVFGREAAIEFPPYDDDLPTVRGIESYLGRTDATNLEAALKLAQASFLKIRQAGGHHFRWRGNPGTSRSSGQSDGRLELNRCDSD